MIKWTRIILLTTLLFGLTAQASVFADPPYLTFTVDKKGYGILTQSAYIPSGLIDGSEIVEGMPGKDAKYVPLSNPEDIFIDTSDNIYAADTGNGRIVEFDPAGKYVRTIGKGVLSKPTGVFVTPEGTVFAADYGKDKVFRFAKDGSLEKEYGQPDSPIFGKDQPYKPKKIAVDKRGQLFIVGEGSVQGLIQMSADGEFMGYFGGNTTSFNLKRYLEKLFYTKEQLNKTMSKLPPSATNVAVDEEGLIYTSTSGLETQGIKKLNVAGKNLLEKIVTDKQIEDITVSRTGNIYSVDAARGRIYEYDSDGNLLFLFGASDEGNQRLGLFKAPSGIAVNSDDTLYVADKQRNLIQVLKPTEFAGLVHQATALYLDGKYAQSEQPWQQVLRLNSMFDLAHTGIGMVAFKAGNYKEAEEEFQLSYNKEQFSNAYWEIRRNWLMDNASKYMIGLIALFAAAAVAKRAYRAYGFGTFAVSGWRGFRRQRFVAQLFHTFRMLRHPIDGYWELEAEGKASVWSATVLLGWLFFVRIFELYQTNFLFAGADPSQINLFTEAFKTFIPFFGWIISNYLVSAINDGEGKFRDIYKGTIYALSPYLIFGIPLTVLSRGLTEMEKVIYDFSMGGIILWCGFLLFIMVKEIHGYELVETVKNILLTLFGMLMMAVIAFILFGLSSQVTDFIYSIYQEVKIRVG